MVNEFPNLKCVFPEPPILSYRRHNNLRNLLVRSRFTPPSSNLTAHHVYLNGARAANSSIQSAIPVLSLTFNLVKLASLQEADVIQVTQFMQQSVQSTS